MRILRASIGTLILALLLSGTVSLVSAGQVDLLDFGRILVGMTEGEVLIRLGPPDHETFDGYTRGNALRKTYYYFSEPERYQNITTIINFIAGRVTKKERLYVPFD